MQRMAILRTQGHTEQSSPELAQLVTMFGNIQRQLARLRHLQLAQQGQAQAQLSPQSSQSQGVPLPSNESMPVRQPSLGSMSQINGNMPGPSQAQQQQSQPPSQTGESVHFCNLQCAERFPNP